MTSTTFGYDRHEDRVWMSFDDGEARLWLTRRLVVRLLGPMLAHFESTAPGALGGASPGVRVALEHGLALNEPLPGQRAAPMRMGSEAPAESARATYLMCMRVQARFDERDCRLSFACEEGERVLQLSRVGMHRWLRALYLVAEHGQWALQVLGWLRQSCLPEALQPLVDGSAGAALPPEDEPGPD